MKQPRLQVCEQFSLQILQEATKDWAADCQVGSGAFGDVYGGVDPRDGRTMWAVKRARLLSNSFQKEVGRKTSRRKHGLSVHREVNECELGILKTLQKEVGRLLRSRRRRTGSKALQASLQKEVRCKVDKRSTAH